jgi:hypothetical protein
VLYVPLLLWQVPRLRRQPVSGFYHQSQHSCSLLKFEEVQALCGARAFPRRGDYHQASRSFVHPEVEPDEYGVRTLFRLDA